MLVKIFCEIDDFCKLFEKQFNQNLLTDGKGKRQRPFNLTVSKVMTIWLRKRGIIETIGGILKESLDLEHSRHRSVFGFFTHVISTLIAYNFRENKPLIAYRSAIRIKLDRVRVKIVTKGINFILFCLKNHYFTTFAKRVCGKGK